jgi:hypothetical protein
MPVGPKGNQIHNTACMVRESSAGHIKVAYGCSIEPSSMQ